MPAPPALQVQLFPYQQKALAWMVETEQNEAADVVRFATASGVPLFFGRSCFFASEPAVGGFLAQEMGLGKVSDAHMWYLR